MARKPKVTAEEIETAAPVKAETAPSGRNGRAAVTIVFLTMLLAGALAAAGYLYYRFVYNSPEKVSARETQSILAEVGESMLLPEGETPTLATVTDKEKLAGQPFFQKAENGDKVLIYTSNGRAILYRPSAKKIVDVTTVNVSQPTPGNQQTATGDTVAPQTQEQDTPVPESADTTVALYNGSTKIGVTNTLEDEIKAKFSDVTVAAKDKAAKNDYQGDLVIDLSGKNADLAKKLAESFGGTVGTLPDGEAAPQTDILVIVGNK